MQKYNKEEAILQAWKRKLEGVYTTVSFQEKKRTARNNAMNASIEMQTCTEMTALAPHSPKLEDIKTQKKRREVKNHLLEIINGKGDSFSRFVRFEEEGKRLLNGKHEQGWFWKERFSWFWTILSFFSNIRKKHGSRLRQALEEGVFLPPSTLLAEEAYLPNVQLNTRQFEEALFTQPEAAYSDLLFRIHKETRDETATVLERLHALKYRLSPEVYQNLLYGQFQRHPEEAIRYFYDQYMENKHEIREEQDYIEHELLAQALLDNLVKNTEPLEQRLYSLQKLIMALVLPASKSKKQPLHEFLTKTDSIGARELDNFYGNKKLGLKSDALNMLPPDIRQLGLTTHVSYSEAEGKAFDFPIAILEAMSQQRDKFRFHTNPLLSHLAKLACQELLLVKKTIPWKTNSQEMATLTFLVSKILKSWPEGKKINFTKDICEQLLNPLGTLVSVPPTYQNAVSHANRIIVANLFNLAEYQVQELTQAIGQSRYKKLTKPELCWIVSALKRAIPGAEEWIQRVECCLSNAANEPVVRKAGLSVTQISEKMLSDPGILSQISEKWDQGSYLRSQFFP